MEDLLFPHESLLNAKLRQEFTNLKGIGVWLTGYSGSGKTTLAVKLERLLVESALPAYVLDGDTIRSIFGAHLGFTKEDRAENIRIAGELARILVENGIIVIASFVSPFNVERDKVRRNFEQCDMKFLEVHISTPIQVCESRDSKGLYQKARLGEISDFTGISSPYEPPLNPDRTYDLSDLNSLDFAIKDLLELIINKIN